MIDCQYMNLSGYDVYLIVLQYMNDNFPHMRTEIGIDLKVRRGSVYSVPYAQEL